MPTKSCFTCGYRTLNPQQCPLIGYSYAEDHNRVCPFWTDELNYCAICGTIIPGPHYILTQFSDGNYKPICENCLKRSGTCGGCSKNATCDFETNPSPIPKAVEKRIPQGNQIMIITVKNDARVAETCAKNCDCLDHESQTCNRENETCGNYEEGIF